MVFRSFKIAEVSEHPTSEWTLPHTDSGQERDRRWMRSANFLTKDNEKDRDLRMSHIMAHTQAC